MGHKGIFGLAVLIGFVMSCGDDKPTEPVHDWLGRGLTRASNLVRR